MNYKHICFLSPPFYSHFMPLLTLAKSFHKYGAKVTFGCSIDFKDEIEKAGLHFHEIELSKNKNTKNATDTIQPDSEKIRLHEFFEATKKGPIETLITQSKHRKDDMLYNPMNIANHIKTLSESRDIDLWIYDVLSYNVALALYSLNLSFITFCPPHPRTIPKGEDFYGVPKNWPSIFDINVKDIEKLKEVSLGTTSQFTNIFNQFLEENKFEVAKINNAFRLTSKIAVIYNYFDFYNSNNPSDIYIGHCFEEESLDENWEKILRNKNQLKILITLGTFLSSRTDVLEKLILALEKNYPDALFVVSGGSSFDILKRLGSENIIMEEFIPQKALIPHMDLVIHHGGCNTFTESLYYEKPMVILPFSSDQFNIAYDAEKNNIASILDPNNLREDLIIKAVKNSLKNKSQDTQKWGNYSKAKGPDFAAKKILGM
ncbi:UDP:flavonoid glycosyltransferase YjiC (YdhE family) [Acetoanaerobium pronyense]|uniref:UDP:flavonoid glycosyltransferase YjiC (YdhE family) n=1 Tax=Acetoanaerobium pronyense TaxID=1482736 RepID=A0ABS4KPJ4_9FIRM|nr:glycosyltransferase [Acetoanaerobium pronyense]MBP2028534.1 UDP:flavonoid glycosyltransferase YjiC (YdhE family) [Acetoanaerobium pronyense]